MACSRAAAAAALAFAVALAGVPDAAGQQAVVQDFDRVPDESATACAASQHCNEYYLNRTCFLDESQRIPSLTLNPSNGTVFVGIVLDILTSLFYVQRGTSCALDLFEEEGLIPPGLTIEPVYIMPNGDPESIASGLLCFNMLGGHIKALAGPHSNNGIVPTLTMAKLFKIGSFSSMVTSSELSDATPKTGFPLAARTGFDNHATLRHNLEFAHYLGITKYTLLIVGEEGYQRSILQGAQLFEADFGLFRVNTESLPLSAGQERTDEVLERIKAGKSRVIVYMLDSTYLVTEKMVVQRAAELGMLGEEYQWLGHVWGSFVRNYLPEHKNGYFATLGEVDRQAPIYDRAEACIKSEAPSNPKLSGLKLVVRPDGNVVPESIMFDATFGALFLAIELYQRGVQTLTNELFEEIVHAFSWRGPSGLVSFNENFDRQHLTIAMRNTGNPFDLVATWNAGNFSILQDKSEYWYAGSNYSSLPVEYLMDCNSSEAYTVEVSSCAPDRLVIKTRTPGNSVKYCPIVEPYEIPCDYATYSGNVAAIGVAVFSVVVTVAFATILVWFWKHPMIKSGQREWLLLICIGAIIAELSQLFTFAAPWAMMCTTREFLLSIGSSVMLTAMIAKLWRLKRIMSATTASMKGIKNKELAIYVAGRNALLVVFLIAGAIFSPYHVESILRYTDNGDPVTNLECTRDRAWPHFGASAFIALHAIYACLLANEVRHLPSALSEGGFVFVAVYNASVSAGVAWLFAATDFSASSKATVLSVALLFACTGSVVLFLATRFHVLFTFPKGTDWKRFILDSDMSAAGSRRSSLWRSTNTGD